MEFSASFHSQLTEPMRKELGSVLADQDEVVKMALRELLSDIQALEGDRRLEQQQRQMEKEQLKVEIEAARKEEQIKCQAAIEEMAARIKENMERLEEREQMEAKHKSLIAKMKRDEEERETSSKKVTEALMKEVASRDQQLKSMKEHYEKATSDMNLRLREKNERILSLEKKRDAFKVSMLKDSERWQRRTKEVEDLVLSGAVTTAVIKQRLMAELRTQAETWMLGNASESSTDGHLKSRNVPNVFLKWRIRNDWKKFQGNQAFRNNAPQNCCLSKDIETLILSINAAQDTIKQKYKKKFDKIRNETKKKEAKLVQAELNETAKLEKKNREKMEKIQVTRRHAELKEERKRQIQLKKQREQMQIKNKKEQEQREAKRAETESRGQHESNTGRRRFFRAHL